MASWSFQMVDNNKLTTISDLTPHAIYTIRVQAYTSVGPGPMSAPVQVKTQQGGMFMKNPILSWSLSIFFNYSTWPTT